MTASVHIGDVRAVLATMEPGSIDLVLTSSPFFGLRSYLDADDPNKPLEIGGEQTPGEFIDALLDVIEAIEPVLAPHGSIVWELGDSRSGSGGAGGDYANGGAREGQNRFDGTAVKAARAGGPAERPRPPRNRFRSPDESARGADLRNLGNTSRGNIGRARENPHAWPLDRSLCLIPELFRIALVYGRNPLTGRETPRWRARNVYRWARPNPAVGFLGDKFRDATSELVIVCKNRRWFDLDAVRKPLQEPDRVFAAKPLDPNPTHGAPSDRPFTQNQAGAPPLDWITLPTAMYQGSHYAVWPIDLLTIPIKAMCPLEVCVACGKPRERITEPAASYTEARGGGGDFARNSRDDDEVSGRTPKSQESGFTAAFVTVGWTDCGCGAGWRPGRVLDPFAGSGTTLLAAVGHGRDAVGIDLDARNLSLMQERLGMLLGDVADHRPPAAQVTSPAAAGKVRSPLFREGTERPDRPGQVRTKAWPPAEATS